MTLIRYGMFCLCSLLAGAVYALGWEQVEYIAVISPTKFAHLLFDPADDLQQHGLMVYSDPTVKDFAFCMERWPGRKSDPEGLMYCGQLGLIKPKRIYQQSQAKKQAKEAEGIFARYRGKRGECETGNFAGYLVCVEGCEALHSPLLVKIEHTECVD